MGKIVRENTFDERKKRPGLKFNPWLALIAGGGDTWVFFGWVCAAWDSRLAPRSKKKFP